MCWDACTYEIQELYHWVTPAVSGCADSTIERSSVDFDSFTFLKSCEDASQARSQSQLSKSRMSNVRSKGYTTHTTLHTHTAYTRTYMVSMSKNSIHYVTRADNSAALPPIPRMPLQRATIKILKALSLYTCFPCKGLWECSAYQIMAILALCWKN